VEGAKEALGEAKAEGLEESIASEKKSIEERDAGKFTEFRWEPEDKAFTLVIVFAQPQLEKKKNEIVKEALGQAYKHVTNLIHMTPLNPLLPSKATSYSMIPLKNSESFTIAFPSFKKRLVLPRYFSILLSLAFISHLPESKGTVWA
jgi:hypothetical protein